MRGPQAPCVDADCHECRDPHCVFACRRRAAEEAARRRALENRPKEKLQARCVAA